MRVAMLLVLVLLLVAPEALAVLRGEGHTFHSVLIRLNDPDYFDAAYAEEPLCHEFLHATTGIRDDYGAAPNTSCVWGNLPSPGPVDVAYARKVYKKHR